MSRKRAAPTCSARRTSRHWWLTSRRRKCPITGRVYAVQGGAISRRAGTTSRRSKPRAVADRRHRRPASQLIRVALMIQWSESDLLIRDAGARVHRQATAPRTWTRWPRCRRTRSSESCSASSDSRCGRRGGQEHAGPGAGASGWRTLGKAAGSAASMAAIMISELAGVSLGTVAACALSLGLGAATWPAARWRRRSALAAGHDGKGCGVGDHGTGLGSDAFGGMKTYVRRDGRTTSERPEDVHHQRPTWTHGDRLRQARRDGGGQARPVRCSRSCLTPECKPFKKMGMHALPTGELFFDVRLSPERLLGRKQ